MWFRSRGIGELHHDLEALERKVKTLTERMDTMDAQVANVVADVAALKTNVAGISAEITKLLAQIAAGIDAEDEAAITAAHNDLVTANAALASLSGGVVPPSAAAGVPA